MEWGLCHNAGEVSEGVPWKVSAGIEENTVRYEQFLKKTGTFSSRNGLEDAGNRVVWNLRIAKTL